RGTEPEQAYARFREYLSLGAGRTLDGHADRLAEPKHFLDQLRRAWDCTRRAHAYDQAVANSLARARHAARDRAARRAPASPPATVPPDEPRRPRSRPWRPPKPGSRTSTWPSLGRRPPPSC